MAISCGVWDPMGHDRCALPSGHVDPFHVGMMEKWATQTYERATTEAVKIRKPRKTGEHPELSNCFYCGEHMSKKVQDRDPDRWTKDHYVPLALGGLDKLANKVQACFWCNYSKGNLLVSEWIGLLAIMDLARRGPIAERKGAAVLVRFRDGLLERSTP